MSYWTVETTWYSTNDGELKTVDLDGSNRRNRTAQDAADLAGRYVLSLVVTAKEQGGAHVQAVGRMGWRVTFPDGYTETIMLIEHP